MNEKEFGTLYRFELRKLMRRPLYLVTLGTCLALIVLGLISPMLLHEYAEERLLDLRYRKELSGRMLDQSMLEEMSAGYRSIPADAEIWSETEEFRQNARPYRAIFNLARLWLSTDSDGVVAWQPSEEAFYAAREKRVTDRWDDLYLTDAEKAFWRAQEDALQTPFRYEDHSAWDEMQNLLRTIGVLMMVFELVTLAGLFPDEHVRRTDQLILSSYNGRTVLYGAKAAAGITAAVLGAALMAALCTGIALAMYSTQGFDAPIQIVYGNSLLCISAPLTVGQAALLEWASLMAAAVVWAAFVMLLSELLHGAVAAMGISTALVLAGMMLNLPERWRVLAQLWDWLPSSFLAVWNVFDVRTLPLGSVCLPAWQVVPVLYLLAAALLTAGGWTLYRRYQVSGR